MTDLVLTVLAFALASAVNTASQVVEARTGFLRRRFGARRSWGVHLALIAPGWTVFFVLLSRLGEPLGWPLPESAWVIGPLVVVVGVALSVTALVQLGLVATLNGWVFGVGRREIVRGGAFARLENPMYDGFVLMFAGTGFWGTNSAHLVLAVASCLILNLVEARVENRLLDGGHG